MTDQPTRPDAAAGRPEQGPPQDAPAGSPTAGEQMTRDLVDDVAAYEVDPPPPARVTRPPQP